MTTDSNDVIAAFEARAERRHNRRAFFTAATVAGGAAAFAVASPAFAQTSPSPTPTPALTNADLFNFALNLEYLEANFYAFATGGAAIPAASQTGVTNTTSGVQGAATGGRAVTFRDPVVAQFAREIAADELAHVNYLRTELGAAAVAQPAIDLSPGGAFSTAARAAGLVSATETFDPYASDENFLLAAFLFEDVGVTAYKGATPLLTGNSANELARLVEAASGILSAEAYHAATIRGALYARGFAMPSLIQATEAISAARDRLDGNPALNTLTGVGPDADQGVAPAGSGDATVANIAPLNGNGLAYSRSPQQVLNIVYLNAAQVSLGGFFPAGVNGTVRASAVAS